MTSLSARAKIWAKTVFFNACLQCIVSFFTIDFWAIIKSMIYLFGGFAVTLPLVFAIVPLAALSTRLPYAIHARIAWLVFYLIVLAVLLCWFWSNILAEANSKSELFLQLAGTIIASLLLAVLTTRKSLFKLNNQNHEQHLV